MPPKQDKQKPLTKKEKRELALKLKQEEEERQRQEEERQRQIKEEEDRKRRAEEERLAKEELKRLQEENQKNDDWVITMKKARQASEQEIRQQQDWLKFKICNPQADPEKEFELTTFITQYRETPTVSNLQIQETLDSMQYAEEIVNEIYELYMRSKAEGRLQDAEKYRDYVNQIRQITLRKIVECTSDITKNSEKLAEEEEEKEKKKNADQVGKKSGGDDKKKPDVYKVYKNMPDFRYGMWINPNTKSGIRHRNPIEFQHSKMAMDVPSRLMHQAFLMKACWTSFDYLSDPIKYDKNLVIGGVLDIQCIERPPLQVKGIQWTLKQDFEVKESIKCLNHVQDGQGGQALTSLTVHYPLPDYLKIYPKQKHQIAIYDESQQAWVKGNIVDIVYEQEKKLLRFKTNKIAPFAYVIERCTDYPYQKFFMRAVDDNKVVIDIMTMRDTHVFEIGPGYALLRGNDQHPELKHIQDKKFSVGTLLFQLQKCGINLMPREEDAETATIKNKSSKTEDLAIQDICQGIRSFFVRSSAFSFNLDEEKILVRIRENVEYDEMTYGEDQEKDWKSICWYPNKCAAIRAGDKGEYCDERFLQDTVAHINLEYTLNSHNLTEPWALERMRETDYIVMQDTLAQFLKLTHILTFTVFEQDKQDEEEEEQKQQEEQQNNEGEGNEEQGNVNTENQENNEQNKEGQNQGEVKEEQKEGDKQ